MKECWDYFNKHMGSNRESAPRSFQANLSTETEEAQEEKKCCFKRKQSYQEYEVALKGNSLTKSKKLL